MKRTVGVASLVAVPLLLFSAGQSVAQSALYGAPPTNFTLDERGVDLVAGSYNLSSTDVSIGSPGAGGLSYSRSYVGSGWRDSITATIQKSGTTYYVSIGGASQQFTLTGGVFIPKTNDGSTLVETSPGFSVYTDASGVVYSFTPAETVGQPTNNNGGQIDRIDYPDGRSLTYSYSSVTVSTGGPDPFVTVERIRAVTGTGYALQLEYALDNPTTTGQLPSFYRITKVTAYNTEVDSCTSTPCSFTQTWPSATYSVSGTTQTVTDQSGRTTTYTFSGNKVATLQSPSSPTPDVTIGYATGGLVSSVAMGGGTWSYDFVTAGSTRTVTVTDPDSNDWVGVSNQTTSRLTSWRDPLLNTTGYLYDSEGRTTRVTQPEGNYVAYGYDTRGNVTLTTAVAKSGSGLANITTSAVYPASCTYPATCNKPTSTTYARGYVTNYTYNNTHGGVLTATSPAPVSGGVRPQTRYTYTTTSGLTTLTEVSQCTTGATCDATANEIIATIAYSGAGVANALAPTSVTSGSGSGSPTAVTAMTYTANGDVATVDGPLPGTADTTTYRYDDARQQVGVIGPDPDGAGPRPRRAIRQTYDGDGNVTLAEQGTVLGTTDGDWSAFAPLQWARTAYDSLGRPTHVRSQAGSTTYGLQQVTYDTSGRVLCSTTRMNPATFAAPPSSACSLATTGSFGADRITRNTFDAAGRAATVTSGYGASAASTETATYTDNGQPLTLVDGEANISTYLYDGFDRVSRLRYPNPTTSGSSTTDYDEYGYDAASNIVSSRSRSATAVFAITYDRLNRPTLIDAPSGTDDIAYSYDNLGRSLSAVGGSRTLTFVWDALGRQSSETSALGTVAYQYDLAGRRTRIIWPDAFYILYDHDVTGAVTRVREAGAGSGPGVLATYAYDDLGRLARTVRGNGVNTDYSYDPVSRPTQIANDLASTASDQTIDLSYNPASQIIARAGSNPAYAWTDGVIATRTYTNNGRNQVTAVGAQPVTYDARQNITSNGVNTFTYNAYNQLTSVSGVATYEYDPLGRLARDAASVTYQLLYAGDQPIGAYSAAGNLSHRYVPSPWEDERAGWYSSTGARYAPVTDERGSVIANTGGSGTVLTAVLSYDEYGVPGTSNTQRFQYTGQMRLADTDLYSYKARIYDPTLGRFLQTDPVGYAAGMNLYAYVGGDPVNVIDPSGLRGQRGTGLCDVPVPPRTCYDGLPGVDVNVKITNVYVDISANNGGAGRGPGVTGVLALPPGEPTECEGDQRAGEVGKKAAGLPDGYYGTAEGGSAGAVAVIELKWAQWNRVQNQVVTESFNTFTFSGGVGWAATAGGSVVYSRSDPRGSGWTLNVDAGPFGGSLQGSRGTTNFSGSVGHGFGPGGAMWGGSNTKGTGCQTTLGGSQ